MKSLFLKVLMLFCLVVLVLVPVAKKFDSGEVDPFYTRFTTSKPHSLILGTSRAAQGLQPKEFESLAPGIQNFAFTIGHSPYGPAYLELVKEKVSQKAVNGVFLLAVDPWALSHIYKEEKEEDVESYREHGRFTTEINLVNANPNFEYILRFYDEPLYKVFRTGRLPLKLHKDGWLEVNIPIDTIKFQASTASKIGEYQKHRINGSMSTTRLKSLEETIDFLGQHGKVYLVRMPVAQEVAEIEAAYAPEFDDQMEAIAVAKKVPYLNYFNQSGKYLTTDGNHLHKVAGKAFSAKVAEDIKEIRQVAYWR